MDIEYASLSDPGRVRENNEDSCSGIIPDDGDARAGSGALFIVADGMGGHRGGEIASGLAVKTIGEQYYQSEGDATKALLSAFNAANAAIFGEASADATLMGMGTTCTALALRGGEAYVAHVGDSRAYLVRDGDVRQITMDHSLVGEMVRSGIISDEDARTHPKRHVITRSLGVQESIETDTLESPLPARAGDTFVLCSDGLTSYVEADEIRGVVGSESPAEACKSLVALANNRGGRDNITVLVIAVRQL
jgi:protein phosphatase